MIWRLTFIVLLVINFGSLTFGAHILAIFPYTLRSHLNFGEVILIELAKRGHKISVVSPIDLRQHHENIIEIRISGGDDHLRELGFAGNDYQRKRGQYVNEELINMVYETTALMNYTLSYPLMQDIISDMDKYDLLMFDSYFSDSLLGLAYHWQIPSVALCAVSANKWSNEIVGNPNKAAFNPSIYTEYSDRMNIFERLFNSLESTFEDITYNYMYLPSQEAIFKRYFEHLLPKRKTLPPLIDIIHNVSLVLLNSHPALQYPRPYVPNVIQIGGVHIKLNTVKLPQNLLEFIEAAPEGVILMSLGTTRSADLSMEQISMFSKVFARYSNRMRIIWKWENATMIDQPDNVIIGPWLPQQAILAHPNVRLFITHGGLFGLMEAIYFGVPVIGIPLFGDEPFKVALTVNRGFGIKLDINNINETFVKASIDQITSNSKYRENALKLSRLFRDNPIDPLTNAIYYVEHVLNTGGARHLRSASVDLSIWQRNLIDVWLIIIIIIALILAIPATIICIVLRKVNPNTIPIKDDNKAVPLKRNRRNSNKKFK